ncbi:hypothetical protein [Paenibacillus radicibacter]|uniref:hypothetical protein n=1 Tax=Paenibacillus radicibacter TaxID=2972488 RepID=UPI00215920B9|nr:hypothetical protein [Paenibacillus radicibacter]
MSSLLIACTDNKATQTAVLQGIAKQSEMKSYAFEGSADIKLGDGLVPSTDLVTQTFFNVFKESTIKWNGVTNYDPVAFEADINVTPKGGTEGFNIPVLIKDNKLYFHMPAINKENQFYSIDLAAAGSQASGTVKPEGLKNATSVFSSFVKSITSAVDPKYFQEEKEAAKLKDGSSAKAYTIEINDKNEKAINDMLNSKSGELYDSLKTSGILSNEQADKLKSQNQLKFTVQAPSKLRFVIDDKGFIREQTTELNLAFTGADGAVNKHSLTMNQQFNDINAAPAFKKEIPKDVKSFEDVLKLLNPAKK